MAPRLQTIDEINCFLSVVQKTSHELVMRHGCGWFDGGCYTLASAAIEIIDDLEIFHISRDARFRDHAVLHIGNTNLYFDADGIASESALFRKMRIEEGVHCLCLEAFADFNQKEKEIFKDIKRLLKSRYQTITAT